MMQTILDLLKWSCSFLSAALYLSLASIFSVWNSDLGFAVFRRWSILQHKIFGIDVHVIDENNLSYSDPPYLFVLLNQNSLCEVLIWPQAIPVSFRILINLEFALLPFLGFAMWAMGNPVVVRQWPTQARRALNRCKEIIKTKNAFALSIEGRRSKDGNLSPFKKGAAVLAISSKATIIPMSLKGARECMPYGRWRIKPGMVTLKFHKAIQTNDLRYEDRNLLTHRLRLIAEKEFV